MFPRRLGYIQEAKLEEDSGVERVEVKPREIDRLFTEITDKALNLENGVGVHSQEALRCLQGQTRGETLRNTRELVMMWKHKEKLASSQHSGGRDNLISVGSRPAWATQ